MPKLSRTRIINLNYNDGKRTIYDQVFDYGEGKDTLFSMENGIGKTVLIQFFLQPFVRNKRELQGRRFEDYFTANAPTYIIHEVLLDGGEKLLVGMIIKKDTSEEERNRLRILAFMHKYSKPNDFDLISVPFVDNKRILSFAEAEDRIKKYKSGRLNFKYFNFNDSSKKSEYFEELKAHRLDYKEWEEIIRSINNDESGLSNLYDKHKTDEALLRNVIIPLIESKINGEKNTIGSIRDNLGQYIENYKNSREAIHEVELLKAFQGDMLPVNQLLTEGIAKEESRENLYKRLSSIALLCQEEGLKRGREKLQHEELVAELDQELIQVQYEEYSLKYYQLLAKEEEAKEQWSHFTAEQGAHEEARLKLVKDRYVLECAELNQDLQEKEEHLMETRERIANYERADSEIAQNLRNYKYTLKKLYQEEAKALQEKESLFLAKFKQLEKSLENSSQSLRLNEGKREENIKAQGELSHKIKSFCILEEEFRDKYKDFIYQRNVLLNCYDDRDLSTFKDKLERELMSTEEQRTAIAKEQSTLMVKKKDLEVELKVLAKEIAQARLQLGLVQKDLELFDKETAKILEILAIKNLPLDSLRQREKLMDLLLMENSRFQGELLKVEEQARELRDLIERYQNGLIQLPKEVLEGFRDKGIEFQYALSWLQNHQSTKEEKEELIKRNPFFPYGVILSAKAIELLKQESLEVYTAIPIPIINMSDLNKGVGVTRNNDILTIDNQDFLLAFNHLLIDEVERLDLLKALSFKVQEAQAEAKKLSEALNRNKDYERILKSYPYQGDESEVLGKEICRLERVICEGLTAEESIAKEIETIEQRQEAIHSELRHLERLGIGLIEKRDRFRKFVKEHESFKENTNSLINLERAFHELKKEAEQLQTEINSLQEQIHDGKVELADLTRTLKDCTLKLENLKDINSGIQLPEDKNTLEAKLQACEKELGANLQRDKEDERRLVKEQREIANRLNRIAEEGLLTPEDYKGISFSEVRLKKLKEEIASIDKVLKGLGQQIHSIDKELGVLATQKQRELEDIFNLGFDLPLAKEEIRDPNFKARKKRIEADLRENTMIIKKYQEQISELSSLDLKLGFFKAFASELPKVEKSFRDLSAAIKEVEAELATYDGLRKEITRLEFRLSDEIRKLYEKYRDKHRTLQDRLNHFLSRERKLANHHELTTLLEVIERRLRTLEMDLQLIRDEEEIVSNEILRYTNHLLQELKSIDKKSHIKHLGKTQKLLEIHLPEEKDEESLRAYIKERVNFFAELEGDYKSQLTNDLQSAELLSRLVGNINRVRVDIKKIEKTGLVRKRWHEALSQNSGGEKFVSMFILLSSLMSYMRKRETDIDNREEKKILIMDNPFAKTNAEHLLEPMFQIAEKYNIQLLCFSGIGGSSVYNRFDKIYVAKVIEDRFRNKESVAFKAGNEETLELSDFTITREQITMF